MLAYHYILQNYIIQGKFLYTSYSLQQLLVRYLMQLTMVKNAGMYSVSKEGEYCLQVLDRFYHFAHVNFIWHNCAGGRWRKLHIYSSTRLDG